MCLAVQGPQPKYYNQYTNTTYILNTLPMPATAAEQYCNSQGGHLVSYTSLDEQHEVEDYFVSKVGREGRSLPATRHYRCGCASFLPPWGPQH